MFGKERLNRKRIVGISSAFLLDEDVFLNMVFQVAGGGVLRTISPQTLTHQIDIHWQVVTETAEITRPDISAE